MWEVEAVAFQMVCSSPLAAAMNYVNFGKGLRGESVAVCGGCPDKLWKCGEFSSTSGSHSMDGENCDDEALVTADNNTRDGTG